MWSRSVAPALAIMVAIGGCSHTTTKEIILEPAQPGNSQGVRPSTAATLGVPPGHLPNPGECRIWIPGTPPGHQPKPKSRPCGGIAALAPAGSWIIYRPGEDRKVVHVRMVDAQRPGVVVRIQVFDIATNRLLREEKP
ncbi:MAG TPA: hypothetical protein VGU74_09620 [Gemmatimonadales bacterium]|nr:hypothetical protein [Gemmatimonadales bacterium]